MNLSSRASHILTAAATAVVLTGVGVVAFTFDSRPPAPSIGAIAAADSEAANGGWADPWADWAERCEPLMNRVWGPTEADLARQADENQQIMAAFDEAGIEYELITEDEGAGWVHVEPKHDGPDAWELLDEIYAEIFNDEGTEEHDLMMPEESTALMAYLDEQGIAYEVIEEEDGYRHVEPASDDGYRAMDGFYRAQERDQLAERATESGLNTDDVLSCFDEELELNTSNDAGWWFPFPMDMRMASDHNAMATELMEAFDKAGIEYGRVDVPILQWDNDDEAARAIVEGVAAEHGYVDDMWESESHAAEPAHEPARAGDEG